MELKKREVDTGNLSVKEIEHKIYEYRMRGKFADFNPDTKKIEVYTLK